MGERPSHWIRLWRKQQLPRGVRPQFLRAVACNVTFWKSAVRACQKATRSVCAGAEWQTGSGNTSTDRSGSSGDLAKLFRNEEVKQPGLLAVGAPTVDATIVAREVIQNSWGTLLLSFRGLGASKGFRYLILPFDSSSVRRLERTKSIWWNGWI